jgi:hypothetical protein
MSISSTGLNGSGTIVNSDLFNDVEVLKEQVTTMRSRSVMRTTCLYLTSEVEMATPWLTCVRAQGMRTGV